jgi:hypothetical protein
MMIDSGVVMGEWGGCGGAVSSMWHHSQTHRRQSSHRPTRCCHQSHHPRPPMKRKASMSSPLAMTLSQTEETERETEKGREREGERMREGSRRATGYIIQSSDARKNARYGVCV